jgi:hypothetical protein
VELILNVVGAIVCVSMARKRGRGTIRWFFLGLFFHVIAIGVLYFLGHRDGGRNSPVAAPVPTVGWTTLPPRQDSPPPAQRNQQGHVDLNALRAAVRGEGGVGHQQGPAGQPSGQGDVLDPEQRAFLDLVEEVAPTIDFSGLPPAVGRQLREEWLRLGRIFVRSGEAGGVTDGTEFYQLDPSGVGVPVLFYPVAPDNGRSPVVIQFACPVKRFRQAPADLVAWVDARAHGGFADATLFHDPNAGEVVLLAAGTRDMASAPVNEQTLGEWCRQVRLEAEGLRRDMPSRFGGIWVSA